MNIPHSKTEEVLGLHKVELKTQQFKELTKDDLFLLLIKSIEDSWTFQEKGYGVK